MKNETCGTCRHHYFKSDTRSAEEMAALGFGRCALAHSYEYMGKGLVCTFKPFKWEAKI